MKASRARTSRTLGLRTIFWIVMAASLCTLSSAQASSPGQHHGNGQTASDNSESQHFFFGTSHDAKLGTLAWLFCLDKEHHKGEIFVPPRMIGFSELDLGENDGTLTFQSLDFFGKNYRFRGTLKSEEVTGEMQLIDAKSGNPKDKWQLTATQLPPESLRAERTVPARYSNVDYSTEGGDFTGVDIRFFSTGTGTTGMIVFYESYWGEPTLTPLALSGVETTKEAIGFNVEMPNGVARYHLRTTATGGLFNRDDITHEKGEKEIALKRSRVLTAVLGKKE
jgi:hypothetical protein